jgi:hypothetical protein
MIRHPSRYAAILGFVAVTVGCPEDAVVSSIPGLYNVAVTLSNVHKEYWNGSAVVPGGSVHMLLPAEDYPCCLVAEGAVRVASLHVRLHDTIFVRTVELDGRPGAQSRCRVTDPEPLTPSGGKGSLLVTYDNKSTSYQLLCARGWENF